MSEWKEYKLGNAPIEVIDGDRGKNYPPQEEFTSEGACLFLSTKNVRFTGFDFTDCQFISQERDGLLRKGKLKRNDLVLTTRGTIGNIGFYSDDVNYDSVRINSGMVIIRPNENELLPSFNYYVFRHLQKDFLTFTTGSAQPQLPIRDLNEIEIKLPPLPEQTAIAEVLSSLDDKIDLLQRQNKTLEQLAETLFRQWFVEEAEESWEETSLYESINLIGGGTPKTDKQEYWNGNIKWLAGGDIASSHKGFVTDTEKKITELGLQNSSAKLLPEFSTVISARGTVGKYCLLLEPMTFSQSNYGITPKLENCFFFTYLLIAYSVDELQAAAYGSVFDTITTNTFKEHKIRLPEIPVIQQFEKSVTPYFHKIKSNTQQIQTLTQLRNTLLPKLMSGDVRVNY